MPVISQELINRVRANINEPAATTDPLRTDLEIGQWLDDGMYDYVQKIPLDAVPELIEEAFPTGTTWTRPADFMRLLCVIVNHTLSGTVTRSEEASILSIDESYLTLYHPGAIGAWAQWRKDLLAFGPNAYSATIRYVAIPSPIDDPCSTFPLDEEHEEPIVNYATAMALAKINDADAERYLNRYNERIIAEQNRYPTPLRMEKTALKTE